MATNVVMPKMGESITEGTILRWLKQPGDSVKKDEPLLEISTDKVDTEVPAPVAGTLLEQLVKEKDTVEVGTPLAVLGEAGETVPTAKSTPKPTTTQESAPADTAVPAPADTAVPAPADTAVPAPAAAETPASAPPSSAEEAVVMPKMGESITEGTILRWLKKAGDSVKKDESILEISTDKVDTEVPSPIAGTLTRIMAEEKAVVPVGDVIAYIAGVGVADATPPVATAPTSTTPVAKPVSATPVVVAEPQTTKAAAVSSAPATLASTPLSSHGASGRFYSPLVRAIAKQEGVSISDLDTIAGSGLGGRVNKSDMLSYVAGRSSGSRPSTPTPLVTAAPSVTLQPQSAPKPAVAFATDTTIPMDNIRIKIAEHMIRSKQTSAHVTSVGEVDVSGIVKYRQKYKDEFKQREGLNLTYTPIFIEAMVKAIKDFPFINAEIRGTNVVIHKDINFGVAVSVPPTEGSLLPPALIVPVIKKAQNLNSAGIAHALSDLAAKARNKKLTLDDIQGGTFTLTNPGMYGNLFGTPIINQPQLAIMTTGAIVKRAVVKTDANGDDYIAIRSMMYLGLSYDHRMIDGMYGVQFTERVKYYLEAFEGDTL